MKSFSEKYGPWALITGASVGIGREFANQLAEKGLNLVIVSRRKKVLDAQAIELREKYKVQVRVIEADLGQEDSLQNIESTTADLEIGLLVSNAGLGKFGPFLDVDPNTEREVVQVNVVSSMLLTHHFARQMVKRGRDGIILTASTFGYNGVPYGANYGATKSYLVALGEALHVELSQYNVDVCVLSPGPTDTAMIKDLAKDASKLPIKIMPVGPVVAAALKALPSKSSVIPGFMNQMLNFMSKYIMPRSTTSAMFGNMLSGMLGINEKNS